MAKADLLEKAKAAGLVPDDADADSFTADQLKELLDPSVAGGWVASATEPIVAADGHVVLSQEDIDARDS